MKLKGFQYHVPDEPGLPVEVGFGIVGDGGVEITISGKRQQLTIDELLELREAIDVAVERARTLQAATLEDDDLMDRKRQVASLQKEVERHQATQKKAIENEVLYEESLVKVGDAVGLIR